MLVPALLLIQVAAPTPAERLETALRKGALAWQFSGPEDIRSLLGAPMGEETRPDGGMEWLSWIYGPDLTVIFGRQREGKAPHGLFGFGKGEAWTRRDPKEPLRLRSAHDLARLNPFTGLKGVDASSADLRGAGASLRAMPFDTETRWPGKDALPKDFDPAALLKAGRNPGLGLRALHAQGIDGRGVDIAIIDQPLVPDHAETAGRLHMAAELDVKGVPPQMHGPAVSSLAAGSTCGAAPGARLFYVSQPAWKAREGNGYYIQGLEHLLDLNRSGKAKIRVVSISYGGFSSAPQAEIWTALLKRAEAEGVLVITCDLQANGLPYGLLSPVPGGDRDKPEGYTKGNLGRGLLVPGDGRTYASPVGPQAFAYDPTGGMSWGAPWIAGLAAMGFQTNPALTPTRVRAYLQRSATSMPYGTVANPTAFLALCKADPDAQVSRSISPLR